MKGEKASILFVVGLGLSISCGRIVCEKKKKKRRIKKFIRIAISSLFDICPIKIPKKANILKAITRIGTILSRAKPEKRSVKKDIIRRARAISIANIIKKEK
ncbi:MAG: hypothetical protein QXE64_02005 [Candidatus Pacearchaeota archaeon]